MSKNYQEPRNAWKVTYLHQQNYNPSHLCSLLMVSNQVVTHLTTQHLSGDVVLLRSRSQDKLNYHGFEIGRVSKPVPMDKITSGASRLWICPLLQRFTVDENDEHDVKAPVTADETAWFETLEAQDRRLGEVICHMMYSKPQPYVLPTRTMYVQPRVTVHICLAAGPLAFEDTSRQWACEWWIWKPFWPMWRQQQVTL